MINWRKPVIEALLAFSRNDLMDRYRRIRELSRKPRKTIKELQQKKLSTLLVYSYLNVPYYHKALGRAGIVDDNGNVNMENWQKLPFLTKDILRREFDSLKSRAMPEKLCYENSSGGSTGEPVKFLQHTDYMIGDMASHVFFSNFCGKNIGEPELKLWGSERDIFGESPSLSLKLKNFLYNRLSLNSFKMETRNLKQYSEKWNRFKPKVVWTYIDSIYELARFAEQNSLELYPPAAIITTAGTLEPEIRTYLERIFKTKVLNQYGSREVGGIACECMKQHGLHIFEWRQFIEVLDQQDKPCPPGKEGEIVITCLENFAMPLIRYRIGDTGIPGTCDYSCGYNLSVLKSLTGRVTDHFILKDGTLVHGEYFTHLFYFQSWVKKFQVVQKDFDHVRVNVVLSQEKNVEKMKSIKQKIKLVMGEDCRVEFEFVEEIPPSPSGKFLYTKSEVYNKRKKETSSKD